MKSNKINCHDFHLDISLLLIGILDISEDPVVHAIAHSALDRLNFLIEQHEHERKSKMAKKTEPKKPVKKPVKKVVKK